MLSFLHMKYVLIDLYNNIFRPIELLDLPLPLRQLCRCVNPHFYEAAAGVPLPASVSLQQLLHCFSVLHALFLDQQNNGVLFQVQRMQGAVRFLTLKAVFPLVELPAASQRVASALWSCSGSPLTRFCCLKPKNQKGLVGPCPSQGEAMTMIKPAIPPVIDPIKRSSNLRRFASVATA